MGRSISFICGIIMLVGCLMFSHSAIGQEKVIDFEFVTDEGDVLSLDQLKGELVYLSFWATWCKPCIQNFEKYHDFREELRKEGVYLLNINIDKEVEKYKDFISSHPTVNGVNGIPLNLSQVMQDYQLYSIPDYHIINKAGKFVFLSDLPNRDIMAEFKAWLAE